MNELNQFDLTFWDYGAFGGFFLVLSAIGYLAGRHERTSPDEYFLTGRKLPWYVVGGSFSRYQLSGDAFSFDFHWCDNPADLKDLISLSVNGDSAPNRRFNYRCIWRK